MTDTKHINLLVLPELFPEFEGDWKGVFIEDYLKSVTHLNTQTLYIRLTGTQQGEIDENYLKQFKLKRYNVTSKPVPAYLKPFKYLTWFKQGLRLGKAYTDTTIIHAHGAILNGTLAYLIGKKLNVPFIVTEHTGPYSSILNNWLKRNITKFVLNKATKVLVVSKHQKEQVLKLGIPASKIEVSYNPIDTELFKQKAAHNNNQIVFVSRLDEFKGGLRTLKSFHQITKKHPSHQLTIIGEGQQYKAIEQYIATHQLENKVTLAGTQTKAQIAQILQSSSFMVFPSRHETFGLVVAEALSTGLPIVCTNKTAPKEFVNDKNGTLVNPDNIAEIALALEQMINNASNYNAALIRQQIEERFGLKNFGKYLTGVYQNAITCAE